MAKTGLSYYQAETDRFQDIKVKRLKKRYGCEGYAVYQYIQNEIYRVEGCYIRFTDDQLFDVSEYWGIEEQRVEKIIEYCTEVELFDTITWHTNHVLTSVDIQQRYLEICRRAKKKIVIPEDIRLVEIQDVASGVTGAPLPLFSGQEIETKTGKTVYGSPKLDTGKQTATDIGKETVITAGISSGVIIPQSSAEIPETPRNSAEKRHKEKESKENSPSIPRTIPPARDDEDKVSLSPDGNWVHPLRRDNVGRVLQGAVPAPANVSHGIPRVRVVEPVAVLAAVPYRVAVVAGRNIVPVPAAVVAVATLSAVAEDWLPVSAVRQEPEPPSVSVPAVAEDTVEPAAVVGLVRLPVVPAAVVAAEPVLPSVQTDCPCSSPLSVPPPSRQSSSGPAVWRKDVPVRVR